ncbi:hypothetical protein [Lapidilactobacillus achengensis]|uniref:hypothetical protein n=1 Tax=Lapidilactobacillus achengensis TaxID=2486000 RepID=UPI000F7697C0|nr:hypothetical protein [Lapidilactobacillus achengensis]
MKLSLAAWPLRTRLSFEIRAGFAKLKVTPTASSPRISQRKPRTSMKRVHRPSFFRLATQLFWKHRPASKIVARLMLRS